MRMTKSIECFTMAMGIEVEHITPTNPCKVNHGNHGQVTDGILLKGEHGKDMLMQRDGNGPLYVLYIEDGTSVDTGWYQTDTSALTAYALHCMDHGERADKAFTVIGVCEFWKGNVL